LGFAVTIQDRLDRGFRPRLTLQRWMLALLNEPLASPSHRVDVHPQHFRNGHAGQWPLRTIPIGQQQDLRVANLLGRGMTVASDLLETCAMFGIQPDGIQIRDRNCHHPASLPEKCCWQQHTSTSQNKRGELVGWAVPTTSSNYRPIE